MKNILLVLFYILAVCFPAHANVPTDRVLAFNRAEGAAIYENYSLNQSFDKDLLGVTTPTGGTASIVTTSGVKLFGKGSLQFAVTSAGQLTAIRSKPFPIGLNGQTCQTKFTYATPYGGAVTQSEFSYFVTNSSGTKISATATLPATFNIAGTQQSKTAVVFYPCPYNSVTPANSWVELTIEHIGSASTSIIIDEKFDMVANDIGSGVPNNVFSAKVSSTGVVTDENEDFINGNCTVVSQIYTCTYNTNKFLVTPNCSISAPAPALTGLTIGINSQSSSSIAFVVVQDGVVNYTNKSVTITCTRAGSDFIQPAITPNQWNYELRSAGAITIGATTTAPTKGGTITVDRILVGRKGDMAIIRGEYKQTAGGSAGSGDYLFTLPSSLSFDSNKVSFYTTVTGGSGITSNTSSLGSFTITDGTSQGVGVIVPYDATRFRLLFVRANSSSGADRGIVGSGQFGLSSSVISITFDFMAPIAGWTENQNAPQLLGSITNNANGAWRIESAFISSGGVVSGESSDFINGNCSASSPYACTFVSGTFSSTPYCFADAFTTGGAQGSYAGKQIYSASSSGFTLATFNASFVNANYATAIICIGPR